MLGLSGGETMADVKDAEKVRNSIRQKLQNPESGFDYALSLVSGKFKMPILYTLSVYPTVRFNELQRYVHDISYKTLSRNLKELEESGLINRKEYPQIPPKVEYSLTQKGQSIIVILDQFSAWGEDHIAKTKSS